MWSADPNSCACVASLITVHCVLQLAELCCRERGKEALEGLTSILPHFDCWLGHYDSWEEARGLLLWRAFDCSVNGVSDAPFQVPGSGKAVQGSSKIEKVRRLWQQGRLPLPMHQASTPVSGPVTDLKRAPYIKE